MDDSRLAKQIDQLQKGTVELVGLLDWGSNYTFLVNVCQSATEDDDSAELQAVYKPKRGERPLWDFPPGTLYQRERAAFLVSELLGWRIVPPTIIRDGPYGTGSVQLFIEHDPEIHYFTFQGQFSDQIQRIILFDLIINNADRKAGHVLLDEEDKVWSIDHGICFHEEFKLRSVIWELAGQPLPQPLQYEINAFLTALDDPDSSYATELISLLSPDELLAMQLRTLQLLESNVFPLPGSGRHFPWPPV
jgi:hypothetical protein